MCLSRADGVRLILPRGGCIVPQFVVLIPPNGGAEDELGEGVYLIGKAELRANAVCKGAEVLLLLGEETCRIGAELLGKFFALGNAVCVAIAAVAF